MGFLGKLFGKKNKQEQKVSADIEFEETIERSAAEAETVAEQQITEMAETVEQSATDTKAAIEQDIAETVATIEQSATDVETVAEQQITEMAETVEQSATETKAAIEQDIAETVATIEQSATDVETVAEQQITEMAEAVEQSATETKAAIEQDFAEKAAMVDQSAAAIDCSPLDFETTIIKQPVDFETAVENVAVAPELAVEETFPEAEIKETQPFEASEIEHEQSFEETEISSQDSLDILETEQAADFDESEIADEQTFAEAEITPKNSFETSETEQVADFDGSEIKKEQTFDEAEIVDHQSIETSEHMSEDVDLEPEIVLGQPTETLATSIEQLIPKDEAATPVIASAVPIEEKLKHKIFPRIKNAAADNLAVVYNEPLGGDLVLTFVQDINNKILYVLKSEAEQLKPLIAQWQENIAKVPFEFFKSVKWGGLIVFNQPGDYSNEKIFDINFINQACRQLDTDKLIVSMSRRYRMHLTSYYNAFHDLEKFFYKHFDTWSADQLDNEEITEYVLVAEKDKGVTAIAHMGFRIKAYQKGDNFLLSYSANADGVIGDRIDFAEIIEKRKEPFFLE